MEVSEVSFIIPMISIAAISLILYMLTNRSFGALIGIAGTAIAVMVYSGGLDSAFYVISVLFLGMGFYTELRGDGSE